MRRALIPVVMLLAVAACGPIAGIGTSAPTAASVAVQAGDLAT
jgi:hypothetical protein